jgi:hypothetical protein
MCLNRRTPFRAPGLRRSVPLAVALGLIFPSLLSGQSAARDALANFPADTQQILYSNLAQLRALPDYQRIRPWIITQQLGTFEGILRSFRTDPEKEIDEVTLGWRGDAATSAFVGLAEGRFQPEVTHDYFVQRQLPYQQYAGYELYGFGSTTDRESLFFAFFDSSTAVFGRMSDLKAVLDVRAGGRPGLQSNSDFANAEAELEGSAAQWGIVRGPVAASAAVPLLTGGVKLPADPKALLEPLRVVLYRLDWGGQLSMHMSLLCRDAESATKLSHALALLRVVQPNPGSDSPSGSAVGVLALFQGMDVQTNGSRLDMSGPVPAALAEQVLHNAGSLIAP